MDTFSKLAPRQGKVVEFALFWWTERGGNCGGSEHLYENRQTRLGFRQIVADAGIGCVTALSTQKVGLEPDIHAPLSTNNGSLPPLSAATSHVLSGPLSGNVTFQVESEGNEVI